MWISEDKTIVIMTIKEDKECEVWVVCKAAHGFGFVEKLERGNYVIYVAHSCHCHPGNYFLEVNKKQKE